MTKKKKYTTWFLSWDMFGLESAINVDEYRTGHEEYEKKVVWGTLQGNDTVGADPEREFNRIASSILMRARANSHRHYEVYSVTMPAEISVDQVTEMFKVNPQGMADLVRSKGQKHFSARLATGKAVIQ